MDTPIGEWYFYNKDGSRDFYDLYENGIIKKRVKFEQTDKINYKLKY